jgi:SAM-dependent methyltransferase
VEEIAAELDLAGASISVVEAILSAAVQQGVVEPFTTSPPITVASDESVLTLLDGYFATKVLYSMHRCGALAMIEIPMSAASVARALDVDAVWLETALEFLALRTTVVQRLPDHRFQAACLPYENLGFALDKFVGAYGPCLEHDGPAPEAVDGHQLAKAFERVTSERTALSSRPSTIATLVEQWDVAADVVDLGCGSGGVLVELATRSSAFRGIGVDQNASMVEAARRALAEFQLDGQVDVLEGDAVSQLSSLPPDRLRAVTAVHARSFFNACFGVGPRHAAEEVRALSRLFAGRLLFVDDYYGELGRQAASSATPRWAVLQDIVQSWSGQGIPPGTRDEWAEVYAFGGARLLHSYEDELDGFRRFIHVVRLGAEE